VLPSGAEAKVVANWSNWPIALLPLSFLGLLLAVRLWNARPQPRAAPQPAPSPDLAPAAPSPAPRTGTKG
jgi:MFS transporter, OPA family, glycerol-3-phosphate transporter